MPLKGEVKREYQRLWIARRRSLKRWVRGSMRGRGVEPVEPTKSKHVEPSVSNPLKKSVEPVEPRVNPYGSKSAQDAFRYVAYINARGYTVEERPQEETGELRYTPVRLPWEEAMEALRAELRATQMNLAALQVDISMQRAEAVLDDHLREAEEP